MIEEKPHPVVVVIDKIKDGVVDSVHSWPDSEHLHQ